MSCSDIQSQYTQVKFLKVAYDAAFAARDIRKTRLLHNELEKQRSLLIEQIWPLESLPLKELKKQYDAQIAMLQKVGLLETLKNNELGIRAIDGKEYPLPSIKEITRSLRENRDLMKTKTKQGFQELIIVPFGLKLNDIIQKYQETLWRHYQEKKLFRTMENREDEPNFPDDLPFDQDTIDKIKSGTIKYQDVWKKDGDPFSNQNDALWVWKKYRDADTRGELVYHPQEFSANHGGKTKMEILKEGKLPAFPASRSFSGGWSVLLLENLPNIPRETKGKTVGGRKQIETNQSPTDYLKRLQTNPQYQGESGMTPEEQIIYAITYLEERSQVIDDYWGNGSLSYQLGAYLRAFFRASSLVPYSYWGRDYAQAHLGRVDPSFLDSRFGARSSVRVL